jgi:chorismate dehydratase
MNRPPGLEGLRLGCVQYLNSRPLIYGLEDVVLAHPSALAARLREGALDAALVPVFELLRSPGDYRFVDGVAIASHGPVYSVFVAHSRPLNELEGVTADPASLTSIHLFEVLSAELLQKRLPLVPEDSGNVRNPVFGRLLIGNQAIERRLAHGAGVDGESFWDLGEQWTLWTGLPFVYAVWVLRRGIPDAAHVANAFRSLAAAGIRAIPEIALSHSEFGEALALRYLTEHIRFTLGAREQEGLARFSRELEQRGFVPPNRAALEFL